MFNQGSSPVRTRCMNGSYPARHAWANSSQSTASAFCLPSTRPSRMMVLRQSTTVPKTSKVSAFMEERFMGRMG